MSNSLPLLAAIGLFSGFAGAGLSSVILSPNTAETTQALETGPAEVDLSGVMAQFKEINSRLDEMEMEVAQANIRREVPAASAVDMDDVMDQLKQYMAQLNNPAAAMPPNFENWVEDANDAIRARDREERDAARAEREEKRMEDRLSEMSEKLGLNNDQLASMRTTLTEARSASSQLMSDIRETGWGADSRDMMRQGMTEIRETSATALQGFLSTGQYETYQADYGNENWGFGRGGGGGGDTRGNNRRGGNRDGI
jgi:phage shock protein A